MEKIIKCEDSNKNLLHGIRFMGCSREGGMKNLLKIMRRRMEKIRKKKVKKTHYGMKPKKCNSNKTRTRIL